MCTSISAKDSFTFFPSVHPFVLCIHCISNGYGNQLAELLSLLGANTYEVLVFNNLSILEEETVTFLFVLE